MTHRHSVLLNERKVVRHAIAVLKRARRRRLEALALIRSSGEAHVTIR
jgi:hypothetical protein